MRIRKNRKLSNDLGLGLKFNVEQLQPHSCPLNQSPWDAICFSQQPVHQFESQKRFRANEILDGSVNATNGVDRRKKMPTNDIDEKEKTVTDNQETSCESKLGFNKNDDNGVWCCNKKNKEEDSTQGHDFLHLKACTSTSIDCGVCLALMNSQIKPTARVMDGVCEGKGLKPGKKARVLSPNKQEFYYYSGFGPLWGKKKDRGKRNNNSMVH